MKKIISIFFAVVFVLCLSPPIFAAEQTKGQTDLSFTYTPASPAYTVEVGGTWTQGSRNGLVITTNAGITNIAGIKVDGVLLDAADYTAVSGTGGTVVTLKPEFLSTLTIGQHSIELIFTDGSVQTWFTVLAENNNSGESGYSTDNSDNNNNGGDDVDDTDNGDGDDNDNGNTGDNGNIAETTEPEQSATSDRQPKELPRKSDESHTIVIDPDRPNVYIEIDGDGVPLGEWYWDEEKEIWVFVEYSVSFAPIDIADGADDIDNTDNTGSTDTMGNLPNTGDDIFLWFLLGGASAFALGVLLKASGRKKNMQEKF